MGADKGCGLEWYLMLRAAPEFGNTEQVVSGDREGEDRFGLGAASNLDLGEAGLRLDPAERR